MAIKKQEFYEGAALHLLLRTGSVRVVHYDAPFFLLNERLLVLLKYSTKTRSPWGFTFSAVEQVLLNERAAMLSVVVGLVCGGDGVAAIPYQALNSIARLTDAAIHIGCHRKYDKHYELNGPDGTLKNKIAPSQWLKILSH